MEYSRTFPAGIERAVEVKDDRSGCQVLVLELVRHDDGVGRHRELGPDLGQHGVDVRHKGYDGYGSVEGERTGMERVFGHGKMGMDKV